MDDIITKAVDKKQKNLSEYDSKLVLRSAGIEITREKLALTKEEAVEIALEIGFPVVLKGCSDALIHKTEMGMIRLNLLCENDIEKAYDEITATDQQLDGVLVQEMISGKREFVIGLHRDPQFGPCVMFGLGGIFTEVLNDATFRIAPLSRIDAEEMIDEIKSSKLLGDFRGSTAVDRNALVTALMGVGELGMRYDSISGIDVNPLIISGGKPIAVDGLVVMKE